MRAFISVLLICGWAGVAHGQDLAARAWQLEAQGKSAEARELLQKAAEGSTGDAAALLAYAEFLDRHRDPAARAAYNKLAAVSTDPQALRRLVRLDLLAGDREAAAKHAADYRAAGGKLTLQPPPAPPPPGAIATIPGPLRSFARMAALSPDLKPADVLPALARNIVTNGYQAVSSTEPLDQTEYLKLVIRYLSQARELERLAGADKAIRIEACESAQTGELLRVLGYRMRGGCGSDVVLETVNASRAFLTIDSGFPLADLEQALRTNRPFVLDYRPAELPVLYTPDYWTGGAKDAAREKAPDLVDSLIADPSLCRLYLALSKLDPATAEALKASMPVARIKAFAHVLDFYGGMFQIRNGKAVVPGGARAEKAWTELTGVPPEPGAAFFERVLARDDGWLASYFDALARIQGPTREYLTDPDRLRRFYAAIRGRVTSPGPARPVFRSNTDMMLLTNRLRIGPNGQPYVPGGLEVWKALFANYPQGKLDQKLAKSAPAWRGGDDVLEALFGLSRKAVDNEPLKIFMALSDVEANRATPLAPATIDRLAREYRTFGSQYAIFAEVSAVSDAGILAYLDTAKALGQVRDLTLRSDALGVMQSLVSFWQIGYRLGEIPAREADAMLIALLQPFKAVDGPRDVFVAGRSGVELLLAKTNTPKGVSAQDRMIDLLAGTALPNDSDAHTQMMQNMIRIFEAQRLVSLDTLFELANNLESVSKGEKLNLQLAQKLAARIAEVQLPRAALSANERNSFAYGYWTEKHIDSQRKLNLRAAIERAGADANKLKDLEGLLTPILRDTLVGLNYIHYAPPSAQLLMTNPLFVRSHDFIGIQGANQTWKATEVFASGWPASAGGRLIGSLVALPYALAEAEQNFLIPSREQALIWGDLVPQMLQSAVIPRWWNVSRDQLHWINMHMAFGDSLLAEAGVDEEARRSVVAILDRYAAPSRVRAVERLLESSEVAAAHEQVTPSELFLIASETLASAKAGDSALAAGIRNLRSQAPDRLTYAAVSKAFGTPKPTLANSFQPQLLNLRTFPTLMGYSSRILAESWESNLLFFAALADEVQMEPGQLNVMIPAWTAQTVEQIFATHLEDWPALLRSLRAVGDNVRQKSRAAQSAEAAGNQ